MTEAVMDIKSMVDKDLGVEVPETGGIVAGPRASWMTGMASPRY